jgi:hypothetical protein
MSNKKTIIVCPRNIIVTNLYDSILKELSALDINDFSVELFLGGERIKCTNTDKEIFSSDIIITNIDNLLNPLIKNSVAKNSYLITDSNIIFDEFHEFLSKDAYFAGFVNLMYARHNIINAKTVLLSATPDIFNYMWESQLSPEKTIILPNEEQHFIGNPEQLLNVNIIKDVDIRNTPDSLIKTNSRRYAQELKKTHNIDILAHHEFNDVDKELLTDKIINLYDKNNSKNTGKPCVVSTPLIRASLDIAFHTTTESIMDHNSTMQVLGRNNRFGELEQSNANFFKSDDKHEKSAIKNLYDENLSQLWFQTLSNKLKDIKTITLKEMYKFYNQYIIDNKIKIKKYNDDLYDKSLEKFMKMFLYKNNNNKSDKKIISNRISLRGGDVDQIYCIYRIDKTDDYIKIPLARSIFHNRIIEFKEDIYKCNSEIPKIAKKLTADSTYDYNYPRTILRSTTTEELYKISKDSETPYICFDQLYSSFYGVADADFLKNL